MPAQCYFVQCLGPLSSRPWRLIKHWKPRHGIHQMSWLRMARPPLWPCFSAAGTPRWTLDVAATLPAEVESDITAGIFGTSSSVCPQTWKPRNGGSRQPVKPPSPLRATREISLKVGPSPGSPWQRITTLPPPPSYHPRKSAAHHGQNGLSPRSLIY